MLILQNALKNVKKAEKLLTKILEIVKFNKKIIKIIKIIVQEEPYENHRCKGRNHPYPHEKALPYCFCGTGSFAECAGEDLHDEVWWGIGEAAPFEPVTGESAATVLEALKLFRTGLIGMDPLDVEGIHR